jgi:hypothetical protein
MGIDAGFLVTASTASFLVTASTASADPATDEVAILGTDVAWRL